MRARRNPIDPGRARVRQQSSREFQQKVLQGLASAKAGRLVDGKLAFERLEALIEKMERERRGRRAR
ncbi:MAG: hypothetical protein IPJ77_22725 [Planctomycetes bacterium]|nr:hypothetical protein [Planctomycetota bacterium]